MKRITSLLVSLALCCGLAAQTYKLHLKRADNTETTDYKSIQILNDGRVALVSTEWDEELEQYRTDTVDAASLKTLDFLTLGGRKWELDYAHPTFSYSDRADDYGYGSVMHMRDLMTEDMTANSSGYNWYATSMEAIYNPNYAYAHIPWFFYLESIALCNDVIKAIPADVATDAEKAVLAEVLTTRAMLYLDFARMYEFLPNERTAGVTEKGINVNGLTVPIVDENTQDLGEGYFVPRASKAEMVAFIRRDLDRAEDLMPHVTDSSHEVPHMDALYGLRARLALWNGDYADAATYAARAIELSTTRPLTTEQLLSTTQGFNDISCWMWGVQQTEERNLNGNLANFISWLSPEYEEGYASLVPPMAGRSFYERINNADPRKQWFVAPYGSPLYEQIPLINPSASFEPYTAVKFRPAEGKTTENEGCFTAYPLMRVEEMYLIQAEATAYSDAATARELLTDFMRTYRYNTYNCRATDLNGILQEIILQKRIELWGEGQTFFDVKRLNLSVTRNYEGTNFYDASAFNTVGRPYWMNMQFPHAAIEMDPALYGHENPWENKESNPTLNKNLYLTAPTYLETHDVLPLDSIYRFMLTAHLPEGITNDITVEMSLSPEFGLGKTIAYETIYPNEGQEQKPVVQANDLCKNMKRLLGGNGLPQSGYVKAYFRLLTDEACSPFLALPILLPESYEGHYKDFSFAPHVTATTVGEIDCEQMVSENLVKLVNMSIDGEGNFYSYDNSNSDGGFLEICTLYLANYRANFRINAVGQCNNENNSFNEAVLFLYDYVLNQSVDAYTFGDGQIQGTIERDGLIFPFSTDSVAVSLRFNQQMIAEKRHTWFQTSDFLMTSTFDTELTGSQVAIHQAVDDTSLFRLVAPYQRGHNLMFSCDDNGTLTMPRQMASYSNTQGAVYVEGTGTYTADKWTFQLRFTGREAQCVEEFEIVKVEEEWYPLGTGTYREDFITSLFSIENVTYPVKIEQSNTGKIRLVNPYGEAFPYNDTGDFNPDMTYYLTFDISDPHNVMMVPNEAELGMDWGYGMFRIKHLSNYPGTFANGVITFPEDAFYVAMSDYNNGQWTWYGNRNGLFAIALPGYAIP